MLEKEIIFDKEIAPLIQKIYDICEENDIQMLSSFFLGETEEGELICDTYVKSTQNCKSLVNALKVLEYDYTVSPSDTTMNCLLRDYFSDIDDDLDFYDDEVDMDSLQ